MTWTERDHVPEDRRFRPGRCVAPGAMGEDGGLCWVIRKYAWAIPVIVLLGLVGSVLEGIGIGLVPPLVAVLAYGGSPDDMPSAVAWLLQPIAGLEQGSQLLVIGGFVTTLIVLKGVIGTVSALLTGLVEGKMFHEVNRLLSAKVLRMRYHHFIEHGEMRFLNILTTDPWEAVSMARLFFTGLTAVTSIGIFSLFLIYLDWRLALIVLLGGAFVVVVVAILGWRKRGLGEEVVESQHALGGRLVSLVYSVRLIRVFGRERDEALSSEQASERVRKGMLSLDRITSVAAPNLELLILLVFAAVLLTALALDTPLEILLAFMVILVRIQPSARALSEAFLKSATPRAALDQINWFLTMPEGRKPNEDAGAQLRGAPVPQDRTIRFDDVTYRYPVGERGVENLDFEIAEGSRTALLGVSGSGKSTIVNLVCGIIAPQSGTILVGGHPLPEIDLAQWRSRIALAGQDVELIDGTIRHNIAYGDRDAAQDRIEEAARIADVHDFVCQLPEGYDTHVSLFGSTLSGGQRQRIGLARAALRRPDLLILDESTNAIDAHAELTILKRMLDGKMCRSALIVSHRESVLHFCDSGIVIANGRVVEKGPLDQLDYLRHRDGDLDRD